MTEHVRVSAAVKSHCDRGSSDQESVRLELAYHSEVLSVIVMIGSKVANRYT